MGRASLGYALSAQPRAYQTRIRHFASPAALFLCRTLIEAIALCGHKPGLGPAAEFLSLLRQRTESKKGDRRLALRVLTLRFSIICASQKMGRSATRCAQTSALLIPFSVTHKLHCPKRIKVKDSVKSNINSNVNAAGI
ncbi:hypothetical protein ACO0LM_24340 [Undibacterium sp. Di26W]|uniref:hypothetical protein n=1 Tax=Undibacterium sp. Di26W TaxID=3413035 RepID=UPI003BF11B5E